VLCVFDGLREHSIHIDLNFHIHLVSCYVCVVSNYSRLHVQIKTRFCTVKIKTFFFSCQWISEGKLLRKYRFYNSELFTFYSCKTVTPKRDLYN
jgi:hypothetical protein